MESERERERDRERQNETDMVAEYQDEVTWGKEKQRVGEGSGVGIYRERSRKFGREVRNKKRKFLSQRGREGERMNDDEE